MRAILPADLPRVGEADERLVYQGRRLQRVVRTLPGHVSASEPAQLDFDERHQLFERAVIAIAPRPQELRHCSR